MTGVNILRNRSRAPIAASMINARHPFARGLVAAYVPAANTVDLLRGSGASAAGAGRGVVKGEIARTASGELSSSSAVLTTAFSFAMAFRLNATPSGQLCVIARGPNVGGTNSQGFAFAPSHSLPAYSGALMQGTAYSNIGKPTGDTLAAGVDYVIGCSSDGSTASGYSNGVETVSATGLSSPDLTGRLTIGMDSSGGQVLTPGMYLSWLYVWNHKIPNAWQQEIYRNPWQLIAPLPSPVKFFLPTAGAGTTVSVPVGAVSVTGYAPTVSATANQSISVPTGVVSLTGYAPTVSTSASQSISVPAGAVSLTGYAPTVFTTAVTTIAVPVGAVSLAGFAPTISYTTHAYIDVPKGAVGLTGYAPTVLGGESGIWTPVTVDAATWTPQ